MNSLFGFVRREWFSMIIFAMVCIATYVGYREQLDYDTYTKDGVIVVLAKNETTIGQQLQRNHWKKNERCGGGCLPLIVHLDGESGVYILINASNRRDIDYLSSPSEVLDWLGAKQKTVSM